MITLKFYRIKEKGPRHGQDILYFRKGCYSFEVVSTDLAAATVIVEWQEYINGDPTGCCEDENFTPPDDTWELAYLNGNTGEILDDLTLWISHDTLEIKFNGEGEDEESNLEPVPEHSLPIFKQYLRDNLSSKDDEVTRNTLDILYELSKQHHPKAQLSIVSIYLLYVEAQYRLEKGLFLITLDESNLLTSTALGCNLADAEIFNEVYNDICGRHISICISEGMGDLGK